MAASVEVKTLKQGDWTVLQVIGRIDTTTAGTAEKAAMDAVAQTKKLAMDMSALEYISSAGLRILLRIGKKAKREGKNFVLCRVEGMVKEIMEDSGTDMLFQIYESLEDLN